MIVVIGQIDCQPEHTDAVLAMAHEHVERSRAEPGCIRHGVHRDDDDPNRLVFVEYWADLDALRTHFRVPESGEFVRVAATMATSMPTMEIFDATAIDPRG